MQLYSDILTNNTKCMIIIIPVMIPPKMAWLPGDGDIPDPSTYTNHLEKILELNSEIRRFNQQHAKHVSSIFDMEGEGVRTGSKKDPTTGKKLRSHIWTAWKEYDAADPATKTNLFQLSEAKKVAAFNRLLTYIHKEFNQAI